MMAAERQPVDVTAFPAWASGFEDRLRVGADLSKTNWFRVGGPAEWLFKPNDVEDLATFLRALPGDMPVTVLGVGSNLIVRDGGIEGVVVKLGRKFAELRVDGGRMMNDERHSTSSAPVDRHASIITAGAACLDVNVAQFACAHDIAGLEFLVGIPGTIGGAVRMNAGAYGSEMSGVLVKAEIVERDGMVRTLTNEELGFAYRNSRVSAGTIVTRAWLKGQAGQPEDIARRMQDITSARGETQPVRARTGGSTFKNPPGHKAWELIDRAGCRGLKIGGAQVSELHCNFLINTGDATAADLENLGEVVISRVKEETGITLEWEIKRVGKP